MRSATLTWSNLQPDKAFYPAEFRDEMGGALVATYGDRLREVLQGGSLLGLAGVWCTALRD
jgi:hypothetical protein